MSSSVDNKKATKWFVLRDLKRANTKHRAYQLFEEENMEFFTPMKSVLVVVKGKQIRKEVPCIPDLLFVHESRERLDPVIDENPTVQYRWVRNNTANLWWCPMPRWIVSSMPYRWQAFLSIICRKKSRRRC